MIKTIVHPAIEIYVQYTYLTQSEAVILLTFHISLKCDQQNIDNLKL